MFDDFLTYAGEAAFYMTGGTAIVNNAFYLFLWTITSTLLIVIGTLTAVKMITSERMMMRATSFPIMIGAILGFIMTLSVGPYQEKMLRECRIAQTTLTISGVAFVAEREECRVRDNRNEAFGDWKPSNVLIIGEKE